MYNYDKVSLRIDFSKYLFKDGVSLLTRLTPGTQAEMVVDRTSARAARDAIFYVVCHVAVMFDYIIYQKAVIPHSTVYFVRLDWNVCRLYY